MNIKLQILKNYLETNTNEAVDLINRVIKNKIENFKKIETIKNNSLFEGIKVFTNQNPLILTVCNKDDANDLSYKYWAYASKMNINLLEKTDFNAYSKEQHHDVMEIHNDKLNVKIHFIFNNDLVKKELINQDELLVLIENF